MNELKNPLLAMKKNTDFNRIKHRQSRKLRRAQQGPVERHLARMIVVARKSDKILQSIVSMFRKRFH